MSLTADDLAGMNATLNASLPDSCDVMRDTLASNGAGGQTATPVVSSTVPCRVNPLTERIRNAEVEAAIRLRAQSPWVITVPGTTDVKESDRIAWQGREFEIAAALGPNSWDIGTRLICVMIDAGKG